MLKKLKGVFIVNDKDLSWKLFETTGSIDAYLSYVGKGKIDESELEKEANAVGDSPYRWDNNQRS